MHSFTQIFIDEESFIAEMHKISSKLIVTPKYKQLLVKSSMALLFTNIFKKLMHTAPKKLHLPFQRQQT